jgi:hypothetical protein
MTAWSIMSGEPMLNVILMLVLGSGTPDVPQLGRDGVGEGPLSTAVTSRNDVQALRAQLLLADIGEVRGLGDELGRRLVGTTHDDFEELLAEVFDDDGFAAFLGGVMRLTLDVLDRPDLVRAIEAVLEPPKDPEPGTVGARFMEDYKPLEVAFGADALFWLKSQRAQLESAPFFRMDAAMMGRHLLDEVYNPAATPKMAAIARSFVRFFARMLVVRYAMATNEQLRDAYVTGLFEHSTRDVDNVGSLLVSMLGQGSEAPSHRFPPLDLQMESLKQGLNQLHIRRSVQHSRKPVDSTDPDLA